jgi:hypothetical protein
VQSQVQAQQSLPSGSSNRRGASNWEPRPFVESLSDLRQQINSPGRRGSRRLGDSPSIDLFRHSARHHGRSLYARDVRHEGNDAPMSTTGASGGTASPLVPLPRENPIYLQHSREDPTILSRGLCASRPTEGETQPRRGIGCLPRWPRRKKGTIFSLNTILVTNKFRIIRSQLKRTRTGAEHTFSFS